jgi:hypothetical protein
MMLWVGRTRVRIRVEEESFLFSKACKEVLRPTRLPIRPVSHFFLEGRAAEFKNTWTYTYIPPICLHGIDRENFTQHMKDDDTIRYALVTKTIKQINVRLKVLVMIYIIIMTEISMQCWNVS